MRYWYYPVRTIEMACRGNSLLCECVANEAKKEGTKSILLAFSSNSCLLYKLYELPRNPPLMRPWILSQIWRWVFPSSKTFPLSVLTIPAIICKHMKSLSIYFYFHSGSGYSPRLTKFLFSRQTPSKLPFYILSSLLARIFFTSWRTL